MSDACLYFPSVTKFKWNIYVSEQLDNAATIQTTTDGNKSHSLVHICVASMVNTQIQDAVNQMGLLSLTSRSAAE